MRNRNRSSTKNNILKDTAYRNQKEREKCTKLNYLSMVSLLTL